MIHRSLVSLAKYLVLPAILAALGFALAGSLRESRELAEHLAAHLSDDQARARLEATARGEMLVWFGYVITCLFYAAVASGDRRR